MAAPGVLERLVQAEGWGAPGNLKHGKAVTRTDGGGYGKCRGITVSRGVYDGHHTQP